MVRAHHCKERNHYDSPDDKKEGLEGENKGAGEEKMKRKLLIHFKHGTYHCRYKAHAFLGIIIPHGVFDCGKEKNNPRIGVVRINKEKNIR